MLRDAHGLDLSTDAPDAVRGFDHTLQGYLKYRADTAARLQRALAADPDCGMLHVLKGSLAMLAYSRDFVAGVRDSIATAKRCTANATPRERAHVAALAAWAEDGMDRAVPIWEQVLQDHPHDILAFRLHHFCSFWLGRAAGMASTAAAVLPLWDRGLPGYGSVLACHGFAQEECGNYGVAEAAGRAAIALDPGDLWAAHAVAHVLEMQGRRAEGIAWVDGLSHHWEGANNLTHHLWWHCALYHLEHRDFPRVLELYDRRFRDLDSPVTQVMPDLYIDVQNATSMLFRLQRHGVEVGDRWVELADKAEARIGDCLSAFTLPHWMMALAATQRWDAAARLLAAMRDGARGNAGTVARHALPVAEAVLLHARGEHAGAVAAMRPALGGMSALGGSHAQQDVLEQLFLDAAMRAGLTGDARLALERAAGRYPVPPERRVGYAEAARAVAH